MPFKPSRGTCNRRSRRKSNCQPSTPTSNRTTSRWKPNSLNTRNASAKNPKLDATLKPRWSREWATWGGRLSKSSAKSSKWVRKWLCQSTPTSWEWSCRRTLRLVTVLKSNPNSRNSTGWVTRCSRPNVSTKWCVCKSSLTNVNLRKKSWIWKRNPVGSSLISKSKFKLYIRKPMISTIVSW